MEEMSSARCFGGKQGVYRHTSSTLSCDMAFSVFKPDGAGPFPTVFWLSGLTCTEENFTVKAGAQRVAAELGLMVVAPDTSPRGDGVPDDPDGAYDFGLGAGFYVNATQDPWVAHYQMYSYITEELPRIIAASFPSDMKRVGISGHSMGGHGALTMALKRPDLFKSVSAFAPIVSPIHSPWGRKALTGYLGADETKWRAYDACALIEDGARFDRIMVDQGGADQFLEGQLMPERLETACAQHGIDLNLRIHDGYDHSYYFIASFIEDHLKWHSNLLNAC